MWSAMTKQVTNGMWLDFLNKGRTINHYGGRVSGTLFSWPTRHFVPFLRVTAASLFFSILPEPLPHRLMIWGLIWLLLKLRYSIYWVCFPGSSSDKNPPVRNTELDSKLVLHKESINRCLNCKRVYNMVPLQLLKGFCSSTAHFPVFRSYKPFCS